MATIVKNEWADFQQRSEIDRIVREAKSPIYNLFGREINLAFIFMVGEIFKFHYPYISTESDRVVETFTIHTQSGQVNVSAQWKRGEELINIHEEREKLITAWKTYYFNQS